MAHGLPDFGIYQAKTKVASLNDMADLAVRLGSIVEFDRKGDVARVEDFEGTITKWNIALLGATSYVRFTDDTALSGSQCLALSGHPAAGDFGEAIFYTAPYAFGSVGAKISVNFPGVVGNPIFTIRITAYDGTNYFWGEIQYDTLANALSYRDTGGVFQVFAPVVPAMQFNYLFHNLKLVIDCVNGVYARFMFNALEWDLTAYPLDAGLSGIAPQLMTAFRATRQTAFDDHLNIDDFVLTINEP